MKKSTAYIIAILTVLAVGSIIFFVARNSNPQIEQPERSSSTSQETVLSDDTLEITQEEAIRQAEAFEPDGICAQVLTPAVHEETKARYTFPNSCMPGGWQPENDLVED